MDCVRRELSEMNAWIAQWRLLNVELSVSYTGIDSASAPSKEDAMRARGVELEGRGMIEPQEKAASGIMPNSGRVADRSGRAPDIPSQ